MLCNCSKSELTLYPSVQTLLFWTKKRRFHRADGFQIAVRSYVSETAHLISQAHTFILVHEVTLERNMHYSKPILPILFAPSHLLFLKYFGELSQYQISEGHP